MRAGMIVTGTLTNPNNFPSRSSQQKTTDKKFSKHKNVVDELSSKARMFHPSTGLKCTVFQGEPRWPACRLRPWMITTSVKNGKSRHVRGGRCRLPTLFVDDSFFPHTRRHLVPYLMIDLVQEACNTIPSKFLIHAVMFP